MGDTSRRIPSEANLVMSGKRKSQNHIVASRSKGSLQDAVSLRIGNGVVSQAALFLLKMAALEIVRRFSRAKCPWAWRGFQALQFLCYPPFKWLQRFAPFKALVNGMQVVSKPLLVLSIATTFSDEAELFDRTSDGINNSDANIEVQSEVLSECINDSTLDPRAPDQFPQNVEPEMWLVELHKELERQGISLPERIDKGELRRFYTAANGDFSCLLSSVKKTIRWRETYGILSVQELETWSNVVFWHGFDVKHRPCLIVRLGPPVATAPRLVSYPENMDKPLLNGEGSGVPRRGDPPIAFKRRSDAISFGTPYQKAAALVDLAEDGVGLPEQILDQSSFQSAAKFYFLFFRFSFLWALLYFALIILNFLEKPLWCARYTGAVYTCRDRDYFYLGQLPYLNTLEALIFEGITLIVLVVHIFFPISYEGFHLYWKNPLTLFKVTCLLLLVADMLVYALYLSSVAFDSLPFRIAPYIRVIFFILNFRELRSCMLIVAGMLGTYINIVALGLLFLLFASWLAYVMFEDTLQGKIVFTSYGVTLYQMFILFTTSNNPDVWIPAYKASRWFSLFFVIYVLLGVYFVTNLILAVVYDSFKNQLVKQVSGMDKTRKTILKKAFNLLDKDNVGYLNKDQCIQLFEELNNYRTLPNITREEFELIFEELDDSGDFKINLEEFFDLCNAIALRFQKEDSPSLLEKFPSIYHSLFSEKLKAFVRSPKFGYIISFMLIVNLAAVIVETTLDIENSTAQEVWQVAEFVFGWVYVLEMALKVYSFGFENYWRDGQNRFDFLVTWIIVIGETITFVAPEGQTFLSNGEWIRYLIIARMLRLIRLLMHVQRYRAFVATFLTLIPSLMPYLGTIFCVMCIYCTLGVQVFGGIVNDGNALLEGSELYENDYLLFNFNDYPNGMVTLFNLLVMGNWHLWMEGYQEITGTWWSVVYFVSFYLVTVVLLLNLVMAFVLEAFFAEMDLELSEKFEEGEGAKDRRRSLGSKTQSQRIDVLLHHMLSSELTQTQPSNTA